MKILDYSTKGATIHFGQHELLLIMALVQKGKDSPGCDNTISRRIDGQISLANLLIENKRREYLKIMPFTKNSALFSTVTPVLHPLASND
jgi:hypothetical protein